MRSCPPSTAFCDGLTACRRAGHSSSCTCRLRAIIRAIDTPTPGPFPDESEFGRYRNALNYADVSLGMSMRGLEQRGLRDKTLWVVFGESRRSIRPTRGELRPSVSVSEENGHVPFLVAVPGRIAGGIHSAGASCSVDTRADDLDLVGLHPPSSYQGRSSGSPAAPHRAPFSPTTPAACLAFGMGPWSSSLDLDSGRP